MPIWVNQAGVIPVLDGRVCMVTSRSGRRWVFPKGQIDPGHTPGQAALVEAWEEAGLVGALEPEPLGNYVYEKFDRQHHVLMYRMRVVEARVSWPEQTQRDRAWITVAEALERIDEPGLRQLLWRVFGVGNGNAAAFATA